MSGGHFEFGYEYGSGVKGVADELCGEWRDEEINALLFGGGGDGWHRPFTNRERECEFGPRGGGLFESLDYWLAGDISEESYRDDVRRFKLKWLARKTPRNRVEFYEKAFEEYAMDVIEKYKEELSV